MPSERVFRTLDGMLGGEFVQHGLQVLGIIPDQFFEHGLRDGGQCAFAAFARPVPQAGQAFGLPAVKPVVEGRAVKFSCNSLTL